MVKNVVASTNSKTNDTESSTWNNIIKIANFIKVDLITNSRIEIK